MSERSKPRSRSKSRSKRKTMKKREQQNLSFISKKRRMSMTQKKQKTSRQEQIAHNRYLEQNAKMSYIISHGYFLEKPELIKVPSNIRLFQITNPRKSLNVTDAYGIMDQLVTIDNNSLVLNRNIEANDVKMPPIYRSNDKPYYYYFPENIGNEFIVTEPNEETTNIALMFKDTPEKYYAFFKDLHYTLPNGEIIKDFTNFKNATTTLRDILHDISEKYDKNCKKYGFNSNDYPLDIIQLSCKLGASYIDIETLRRDFEQTFKIEPTPEKANCDNTMSLLNMYYRKYKTTYGYFDWLKSNYTPIYDEDRKEYATQYCTNDIMEISDTATENITPIQQITRRKLKAKRPIK